MDHKDAFKDRERALEEGYFRAQDARLLEKLRGESSLDELAEALGEKLKVDDADLLREIRALGITIETGSALLLAPLVQVAWIDGVVSERERKAVLELAAMRGVPAGTPSHAKLVEWLDQRPPDHVFDVALRAIKAGIAVMPTDERLEREERIEDACKHVALSDGGLLSMFGMGGEISSREADLLKTITKRLES